MKKTCWTALLLVGCMILTSCGIQGIPKSKNEVDATWAEVQNQYKRRADLIPSLVEVVKGYAAHEKSTLEAVITARAKATQVNVNANQLDEKSLNQFQENQGALTSALARLMVVVEKYPNLKADQNFRDLQVQLEGTENRITIARQRYIEAIKGYNNNITVPPNSWTNRLFFHYEKKPQFAVEGQPNIDQPPVVKF